MDGDQWAWPKKTKARAPKSPDGVAAPQFISPAFGLFKHAMQAWLGAQRHAALTGRAKDYDHAKVLYQITMERFRAMRAHNQAERDHLAIMRDMIRREVHTGKGRSG